MGWVHAIMLGIVEGLTEFLPVSSTGHLILASHFLKIPQNDFLSSFEIAIQTGAILAVIVLYRKTYLLDFEVLKRVVVAFLPTALVGFVLYRLIKHVLLDNAIVVLWSLLLGGAFLVVFEFLYRGSSARTGTLTSISYRQCFWIGVFQSLAVIPGVSRSAATIIGGLMLGVNRKTIVEFSFLLAVPTLLAATAFDLMKSGARFSVGQFDLIGAGLAVSFIVAILSIKFFLRYIQNHSFTAFGVYRILVALIGWLAL